MLSLVWLLWYGMVDIWYDFVGMVNYTSCRWYTIPGIVGMVWYYGEERVAGDPPRPTCLAH